MDYRGDHPILGIPGTYLNTAEFYPEAPFLKDAPYMSKELAYKYYPVANFYEFEPQWYKIVVMPHLKPGTIDSSKIILEGELESYLRR